MPRALPFALTLIFLAATASAEDWPQWRGPFRDGKSAELGLMKRWPQGGPPLAWKANNCGEGYSAPSISNGRVYLMGNGEKDRNREWIVCLDEKNGQQVWSCMTGAVRSNGGGYPGPRSTPTLANGKVYVMGLAGRIVCCDATTGRPLWFRDVTRDLRGVEPRWGYAESILVDENRVICTPGGENTLVALDANTGKDIWAAKAGDRASYSSPIRAVFNDTPQYVAFTEKGLIGIRAADGVFLWRYDAPSNGQVNCATPIVAGSTVFAASGYGRGGGCASIQLNKEGAFFSKQVYFTNRMQNLHGGLVLVDKYLFGCSDPGVLVCMTYKSGGVVRAARTGRFSLAFADGMLYVRTEMGRVDLYEATSAMPARGTFEQPFRSKQKAWAHPVIANGRLYLRDQYLLLAYDITAKPTDVGPGPKVTAPKVSDDKPAPKTAEPTEGPGPRRAPPAEGPGPRPAPKEGPQPKAS